jgi:hypothetical protein
MAVDGVRFADIDGDGVSKTPRLYDLRSSLVVSGTTISGLIRYLELQQSSKF